MLSPVLVVGATGQLGLKVVQHLRLRGVATRALVRNASRGRMLESLGVECVTGNLDDLDSLRRACKGVAAVVSTASSIVPGKQDRFGERDVHWYQNLTQACREAAVARLVYISAFSSPHDDQVPEFVIKRRVERCIIESGVPYTLFRSAAFMDVYFSVMGSSVPLRGVENPTLDRGFWLTRVFRTLGSQLIEKYGVALVPGNGDVRHAFISVSTVAQCMVNALEVEAMENQVCDIGGPEALSWNEVVGHFQSVLQRRVVGVHLPLALLSATKRVLQAFSPGGANLVAILELIGRVDYVHDSTATMKALGVKPEYARDFLAQRCG